MVMDVGVGRGVEGKDNELFDRFCSAQAGFYFRRQPLSGTQRELTETE